MECQSCEQLLTELNYFRDVEQPAAEQEFQDALWRLNTLIDYLHLNLDVSHPVFNSKPFIDAENLIRVRYVWPEPNDSDDEMPF